MDSILSGIYSGEYVPPIQYVPRGKEYLDLRQRHGRHYDDFYKTLETINPDLAKRFAGIMEEQQELFLFDDEETFMGSFCLGAGLMVEISSAIWRARKFSHKSLWGPPPGQAPSGASRTSRTVRRFPSTVKRTSKPPKRKP